MSLEREQRSMLSPTQKLGKIVTLVSLPHPNGSLSPRTSHLIGLAMISLLMEQRWVEAEPLAPGRAAEYRRRLR
jgi:hypothetical protein